MIKKLSLIAAVVILFNNSASAITTPVLEELVLGIPSINSKNYEEIRQKLVSINGVEVLAYCEKINCFLLRYDAKLIGTPEEIARQVESLSPRYATEIKTGTSISQIIDNCTRLGDPTIKSK